MHDNQMKTTFALQKISDMDVMDAVLQRKSDGQPYNVQESVTKRNKESITKRNNTLQRLYVNLAYVSRELSLLFFCLS